MPNTGRPSGACIQCKKSHTKCDQVRPVCGRCKKANRTCSGYADGLDLVLRPQDQFLKAHSKSRHSSLDRASTGTSERRLTSLSPSPSIMVPLAESEDLHAVSFFVSSFVLYERDTQADRGYLELLPHLLPSMKERSPLSLALAASSNLLFAKRERRLIGLEKHISPKYGIALKATRMALQDPVESRSDETLMAVCLLGFYETAIGSFNAHISVPASAHFDGAAALLRQRPDEARSGFAKAMLVAIRSNIVFRAMQFALPVDQIIQFGDDAFNSSQNPAALLDIISIDVVNLMAAAEQSFKQTVKPKRDASTIATNFLTQAEAINVRLEAWVEIIPTNWFPVSVAVGDTPASAISAGIYGDYCDVYRDVMVSATWNDWRVARLKVLNLLLRSENQETKSRSLTAIRELVDGICASVPFNLGDFTEPQSMYQAHISYPDCDVHPLSKSHQITAMAYGGWYLFVPFKETMNFKPYLPEGQVEWLRGQLFRLARIFEVTPR